MNLGRIYISLITRGMERSQKKGLHKHRILPGYQGGKYVEGNISYLTRKEHRLVHLIRYKLFGNLEEKVAQGFLSGNPTDEVYRELRLLGAVKGGKKSGNQNKVLKKGFCGRTPEKMSEDGRKAGLSTVAKKKGYHKFSSEEHREHSRKGRAVLKEKQQSDPGWYAQVRQKISTAQINRSRSDAEIQALKDWGHKYGSQRAASGGTKEIAHLGGKAHKGRKYIINLVTNRLRRPSLEKAKV